MKLISQIYIDGAFVTPLGAELFDLFNPATAKVIGQVRLANVEDTRLAIAAAKRAFPSFAKTSAQERITYLRRLNNSLIRHFDRLAIAAVEEFGAPISRAEWAIQFAANAFLEAAQTVEEYKFSRKIATAEVVMEPVGVAGLITPWNNNVGFICSKLSAAIAAGCTTVIKPSEMSAIQTQVVTEALHEAGLPPGVFNIVTGRGEVVGAELSENPDIAKISFTGSTAVGFN